MAVAFKPYCYICYILIGKKIYNIVVVVVEGYTHMVSVIEKVCEKNVTPVTVTINPCGRRGERVLHGVL